MTDKNLAGCLVFVLLVAVGGSIALASAMVVAWLATVVSSGLFGHDLAFWPTVAAVFLLQAVAGLLRVVVVKVRY